jgi:hypothetical protein
MSNGGLPANGGGPASQNQEGGLKGVLGVFRVPQGTGTDTQHQRPVSMHESGKRRLILAAGEALQELPIRLLFDARRIDKPMEVADYGVELTPGHLLVSVARTSLQL